MTLTPIEEASSSFCCSERQRWPMREFTSRQSAGVGGDHQRDGDEVEGELDVGVGGEVGHQRQAEDRDARRAAGSR